MAFQCVIVTPEKQILDEEVTQAIVPGHDGQFGILTGRAPLLVKLGMGALHVDLGQGGARRAYLVDGGVAQMKDNRLTILTDEAWDAQSLDPETARAEYAEAEARVAESPEAAKKRQREMRRAQIKQELAAAK